MDRQRFELRATAGEMFVLTALLRFVVDIKELAESKKNDPTE